jgi:addiction module HigA family antidote
MATPYKPRSIDAFAGWKMPEGPDAFRHLPPIHPGEILREDVLPVLGITVSEAARQLRVTRQTLHRVLSGRSGISPEMAVRLGKFSGYSAALWLHLQYAYELWHAHQRLKDEIEKIPAHGRKPKTKSRPWPASEQGPS